MVTWCPIREASRISVSFTRPLVLEVVHTKQQIYRGSEANNQLEPVFVPSRHHVFGPAPYFWGVFRGI